MFVKGRNVSDLFFSGRGVRFIDTCIVVFVCFFVCVFLFVWEGTVLTVEVCVQAEREDGPHDPHKESHTPPTVHIGGEARLSLCIGDSRKTRFSPRRTRFGPAFVGFLPCTPSPEDSGNEEGATADDLFVVFVAFDGDS